MAQPSTTPESAPRVSLSVTHPGDTLESLEQMCSLDFNDPRQEWRRLFSEVLGTFFLVLVAAGGGMMGQAFPDTISRTAAVDRARADGDGDHLVHGQDLGRPPEPGGEHRVRAAGRLPVVARPGYIVVQLGGATLAAWFLQAVVHVSASFGSNYPAAGYSAGAAFWMELILTFGLVSVILGTASGAQNIGVIGAFGVGGYIALAGLWGSPISGSVDEPGPHLRPRPRRARTSRPTGCTSPGRSPVPSLARGLAFVLRGRGGGRAGSGAAQGALFTEVAEPQQYLKPVANDLKEKR